MGHNTVTLEEVKEQARELGLVEEGEPIDMDFYQVRAAQFRERVGLRDSDDQFKALVEEVGELAEAMNRGEDPGSEIADVLVTAFVLADIEGIDAREEYEEKMEHNLRKSGQKQGGKVIDDG